MILLKFQGVVTTSEVDNEYMALFSYEQKHK